MKKEPTIAIIIGILLGVLLASLVIQLTSKPNSTENEISQVDSSQKVNLAKPIETKEDLIVLQSPIDGMSVTEKNVSIKGQAKKPTLVIIQNNSTDLIKELEEGNFEIPIELSEGLNQINLTFYTGKITSTNLIRIYYNKQ